MKTSSVLLLLLLTILTIFPSVLLADLLCAAGRAILQSIKHPKGCSRPLCGWMGKWVSDKIFCKPLNCARRAHTGRRPLSVFLAEGHWTYAGLTCTRGDGAKGPGSPRLTKRVRISLLRWEQRLRLALWPHGARRRHMHHCQRWCWFQWSIAPPNHQQSSSNNQWPKRGKLLMPTFKGSNCDWWLLLPRAGPGDQSQLPRTRKAILPMHS